MDISSTWQSITICNTTEMHAVKNDWLTTDCGPIGGSRVVQRRLLVAVVNWCCRRSGYLLWLISEQSHVAAWCSSSIDYHRCRWHKSHGCPIPNSSNVSHHYWPILIVVCGYHLVLALHLQETSTMHCHRPTTQSRFLLEKLPVTQLVKNEIWRFTAMFIRACY
jgi:hypothetical protein